jgi:PAS domain S-box-containing protein
MGISRTQLADLLESQPLADLTAAGQPVFAVSMPDLDVVWINPAALSLFGVTGSEEMASALEAGTDSVIRQLARTARRSRAGGAPQLQKLLFRRDGRAGTVLTVRCWSVSASVAGQSLFWFAALDAPEALRIPPEKAETASAEKSLQKPDVKQAPDSVPVETAAPLDNVPKEQEPPARRRHVRFMWRSDGDGRLQSIDGALCEVMGCDNGDLIGKTFDELIESLPLQPGGPLRAALARRDTWSRIEVLWPFTGSNKCAPVTLGGLPSFDRAGLFDGYSGFGVIHLDDVVEKPQLIVSRTETPGEDKDSSEGRAGTPGSTLPLEDDHAAGDKPVAGLSQAPQGGPAHGGNVVSLRAWQTGNKTTPDAATRPAEQSVPDPASGEPAAGNNAAGDTGNGSSVIAPRHSEKPDEIGRTRQSENSETSSRDDRHDSAGSAPEEKPGLHLSIPKAGSEGSIELSASERNAFREIARALGARTRDRDDAADDKLPKTSPSTDATPEQTASQNEAATDEVPGKDASGTEVIVGAGKTADKTEDEKFNGGEAEVAAATGSALPEPDDAQNFEPASMTGLAAAIAATHAAARKAAETADKEERDSAGASEIEAEADDAIVDESRPDSDSDESMADDDGLAGDVPAEVVSVDDDAAAGESVESGAASENVASSEDDMEAIDGEALQDSESGASEGNAVAAGGDKAVSERMATEEAVNVGTSVPDQSVSGAGLVPATPMEGDVAPLAAIARQQPSRDSAVAALIDRLGFGVLLSQDGEAVYANQPLLDRLGYRDFNSFQGAGGIIRMFRGRDPELLAREAAGGAIPVITRAGDVLAMDGKAHNASWNGAPATLLTLQPSQMLEREAKLRGLELDIRKRESEVRELHSILDTATDGVALLDEEGRILSLNGSGQALFGYDQNEVVGEKLTVLLARESHGAAMDYFNGLKSNGVRNVLNDGREVVGRASKGGAIPLFMTIGCISNGPEQRFCAVLRDVTQWKKAERELSESRQEAERTSTLKSEFLAKISHEVRTPLNAILGFAEVIIDERFGPIANERYKDYLKDIHASGTHVLSLINDLLDLSKIEAGKLELDFGSVDVSKVVNECVSIMQSHAIRERVIMRLSLAPRLPNVVADERSLRQIILNILSNAVKYNEPGGQVIVSTALTDAGAAVIRVRDTGIGMSDKDVELALEPFRQIATSRKSGGTGLGLPLTKALVEANRASFTIKSKKDEGTLVEVAFPQTRVLAE